MTLIRFKSALKKGVFISVASATLFSCGDPLPEEGAGVSEAKIYSVEEAFKVLAHENDVARGTYTKAIVGGGKAKGLKFDEDWQKGHVEAGPLPALFLRGTSAEIQKTSVPLGLFLGSDFPVNKANEFAGKQKELFEEIKKDKEPKFFFDEENKKYTAMFPDFAVAKPCVSCHNGHPESPKTDWEMGDVMGATTWTFPEDSLTAKQMMSLLAVYREGAAKTYQSYLDKISTFKEAEKPVIGSKWPNQSEELCLPSTEVFMDSLSKVSSYVTLKAMLKN